MFHGAEVQKPSEEIPSSNKITKPLVLWLHNIRSKVSHFSPEYWLLKSLGICLAATFEFLSILGALCINTQTVIPDFLGDFMTKQHIKQYRFMSGSRAIAFIVDLMPSRTLFTLIFF